MHRLHSLQPSNPYVCACVIDREILVLDSFSALLVYPGLEDGSFW